MNRNMTAFDNYVLEHYGSGVMCRNDIKTVIEIKKAVCASCIPSETMSIYYSVSRKIRNRIDELCREPKQLIRAKKIEPQILGIGTICPKCGSNQFSISVPEHGERPVDWPPNVLGSTDCGGCHGDFLVKLAPELERAVYFLLRSNKIDHVATNNSLKAMFPNS